MAKTGYTIAYVIKNEKDDLSDLLKLHQEVFPGNQLAIWKSKEGIVVKVSNYNKITPTLSLADQLKQISFTEVSN